MILESSRRLRPLITLLFLPGGRVCYLLEKRFGLLLKHLFEQGELVRRRVLLIGRSNGCFLGGLYDAHVVQCAQEFQEHLITAFFDI